MGGTTLPYSWTCAQASKTLKLPLSTPTAAKCPNAGRRAPFIDIDMIVGTPPASAPAEAARSRGSIPDQTGRAWDMAEVESRVADSESQRLRDIWCVSSSIPSSTTLLGPRVPRYSLPSLFPISFFGPIGYDAPRTFQPMHKRGSSDWQQTRRIQSFDRFRDRRSPVVLYKYINRKCTTILVER